MFWLRHEIRKLVLSLFFPVFCTLSPLFNSLFLSVTISFHLSFFFIISKINTLLTFDKKRSVALFFFCAAFFSVIKVKWCANILCFKPHEEKLHSIIFITNKWLVTCSNMKCGFVLKWVIHLIWKCGRFFLDGSKICHCVEKKLFVIDDKHQ